MELMLSLDPAPQYDTKKLLQQVKGTLHYVKIGHILAAQGFSPYQELFQHFTLFLDFKFLDIPNTVGTAIKNYKAIFPTLKYYTIHGIAEEAMIKTCVNYADAIPLSVISLSSNTASQDADTFLFQVERNRKMGVTHFVCPPNQVKNMKQQFGQDVVLFVPGIRNENHQTNDHFSTIDVDAAKKLGVDFAIMGRPILESPTPVDVIKSLL